MRLTAVLWLAMFWAWAAMAEIQITVQGQSDGELVELAHGWRVQAKTGQGYVLPAGDWYWQVSGTESNQLGVADGEKVWLTSATSGTNQVVIVQKEQSNVVKVAWAFGYCVALGLSVFSVRLLFRGLKASGECPGGVID